MKNSAIIFKLIHFMKELLPMIFLAVSFAVLGFLTTILIPSVILWGMFSFIQKEVVSIPVYFIIIFALGVFRGVFRYAEHYFGHYVAFKVLADFRRMMFQKLRRLAPSKLDGKSDGKLLKMIGEDIEALEVFFAHTLPPVLTAIIVTLLLTIYFSTVSIVIVCIALLTYSLLAIVLPHYFAKFLQPLLASQNNVRKDYMAFFLESLKGIKDLMQFSKTTSQFDKLVNKSQFVNQKEKEVYEGQVIQTAATFFIVGCAILTVSLTGIYLVQTNQVTFIAALMAIVVFSTSFSPYLELSRLPLGFKKAIQAATDIFEVLEEPELAQTGEEQTLAINSLVTNNITFSYPYRDVPVFQQQSVTFPTGKIIGVVGESGSGKSTMMKLLMRWYDVQTGNIMIDNKAIQTIDRRSVQKSFAYIPQKPQIFSQTIRENLTLGQLISDDTLLEMAEKTGLKDRILSTSNGLDTLLNSERPIFSSGELQRLELTRALLKKVDCYIFDEPTSYLDSLNEATFLTMMKEYCQGTVFLISHRSSTVACADIIYKVDKGQFILDKY